MLKRDRRRRRLRRWSAGWAIFLAVLLAACTSQSGSTGSTAEMGEPAGTGSGSGSGGELIIAMTAGDVPTPDTYPTQGQEGLRFVGFQIYDALTRWDLTQGDTLPKLVGGLATEWEVSEDKLTWTFKLREGVTFHDGTPFNADAVIFNLDRILDQNFPYYNAQAAAGPRSQTTVIAGYEKIDDYTVAITTHEPFSMLPENMAFVTFASPEAVKTYGDDYLEHPSGTGPFKFERLVPGQELVMVRNENYWGGAPKLDRLIVKPMPDASSRTAALLAGEVHWAEAPSPEAVERLKSQGFNLITNTYPHIWRSYLNQDLDVLKDVRVRQALNYAIDRETMAEALLMGLGTPSTQFWYEGHEFYHPDAVKYTYDPEKAKALLAEAGYPGGFSGRIVIPASGSGHMWPIPMTEYIQQNLLAIGVDMKIDVMEWQTMLQNNRAGFPNDRDALGFAWGTPTHTLLSFYNTVHSSSPTNHGKYANPKVDELLDQAYQTFDEAERNALIREASRIATDEAAILFVVHDLNARALAPNVKGFVQPQSWFADLTTVWVE